MTFKLKTLPSLTLGDDVRNKAEIYFDFNFPIVTNTTSTVVSDFTAVDNVEKNTFNLMIAPNPASEYVFIDSDVHIDRIELMDISERLLEGVSFVEKRTHHNLSIEHLHAGVYFIKAYSESGFSIEKIVVE